MSAYIKLATMEYPRHEGDIRLEHPEITEAQTGPSFLCPPGYALVQWVDPPEVNPPLQYAVENAPQLVDDQWYMAWEIKERTEAEWDEIQTRIEKTKPVHHLTQSPEKLSAAGSPPDVIA